MLTVGEVIALSLSELINKGAEAWVSENRTLFTYYNVVTLLISYFFYPAFALAALGILAMLINGFDFAVFALCLVCLLVFSLVTFLEYKITKWTLGDCNGVSGTSFAVAMIFNIPIWIIYIVIFIV